MCKPPTVLLFCLSIVSLLCVLTPLIQFVHMVKIAVPFFWIAAYMLTNRVHIAYWNSVEGKKIVQACSYDREFKMCWHYLIEIENDFAV